MSGTPDHAESDLPRLRRFARAVTGLQSVGDRLVDNAIAACSARTTEPANRLNLFSELDAQLREWPSEDDAPGALRLASDFRRAVLLTTLEGFVPEDTARIMSKGETEVTTLLASGDRAVTPPQSRVFIMEDEPLVAAHISQIVRDMGHTVTGSSASGETAIAACQMNPPDLLLADVMLADGASGPMAAEAICSEFTIPVVYITAYPGRFLRGQYGEPAYLIEKPFAPSAVEAMISQALLRQAFLQPPYV